MKRFDAAQTAHALPYARLVPAIAVAAGELATNRIHAPERQVVGIGGRDVLLCMPATAPDISVTKLITVHPDNPMRGLPAIQGEVIVFDTASGRRLALLDGPTVTARRTAAVSLLGIDRLLPRTPATVLIIGTGAQAVAHVDALVEYFDVRHFQIAARQLASAEAFCTALRQRHRHIAVVALASDTLHMQLPATDVIIALTSARAPVVPAHLPPHTLAIGVGAFKPDMAELPPALLQARQIIVDDLAGARHEAGDLLQAQIDWAAVRPLASVLPGEYRDAALTPVLKTVGQAAWDLAAARVALGG
ncbi:1-piperideine-2-carboxylate/1-pyrroline-2-carboxylate reductase [NAD(P)H] [Actimicrobium sp. GrIS 1.19]|uniref:delta(1)-pyrroline-2-carboxylate reductase family protein n=1 Tax=Actimicrobium sp. GrIS 1.19 TaxID=3071708 RepID=UPI002E078198|nr:1-piperideine-2-carboxylate/1-pyrroline-2-carboxylate reductase [NAD(P)H] [Actimicrobium sp. GrIS 1.19]